MSLNNTLFEAALKQLYPTGSIEQVLYQDHVLLGLIPKRNNFQGKEAKIPIQYGRPQNRSATFSVAQSRGSTSQQTAWLLNMAKNYGFAEVDNLTIESSKTNKGAFVSALKHEMDGAIEGLARNLQSSLYGDGSGNIGQRASVAASTLTLTNEQDIVSIEIGQVIQASPNADGSSVRAGTITVSAVNRDAGTFDFTGSITGFADNDFLFMEGDIGLKLQGTAGWIPSTAPSATPFFNVDRSKDTTRLGGVRFDGTPFTIREALFKAAVRLDREGGKPDYVFMNPDDYASLLAELESDSLYDKAQAKPSTFSKQDYGIVYDVIMIHGPKGPIKVVSDRDCPVGRAFMLTMKTWGLWSIGDPVRVFQLDGTAYLRQAAEDGVEIRCFSYSNVACSAPGYNANIALPAL
jgi:hypothetical protein